MNDSQKKEILDFVTPPFAVMICGIVTAAISPIAYLIANAICTEHWRAVVVGSATAVMGVVFFCLRFI